MNNSRSNYRQGAKRTATNGYDPPSYEPLQLLQQQLQFNRQQEQAGPQQSCAGSNYGGSITYSSTYAIRRDNNQQSGPPNPQYSAYSKHKGDSYSKPPETSAYSRPQYEDALGTSSNRYKWQSSQYGNAETSRPEPKHSDKQTNDSPSQRHRKDKEHNSSYGSQGSDSEEDSLSESKRRCSNTYYNKGLAKYPDQKQAGLGSAPYDDQASNSGNKKLSPSVMLSLITQTLHFLEDKNQEVMLFHNVSHQEGQFLFNLKSCKTLLKKLTAECAPLYMQVLQELALNKTVFHWRITWKRVNGRKVPEYRKKYLTEKQREKAQSEGSPITEEFLRKYLTKTLDFLQGGSRASLSFHDVTDDAQLNFLHNLTFMKPRKIKRQMDPECMAIYLNILRVRDQKKRSFVWQAIWSKRDFQKVLTYRKVPPDECPEPEGSKKWRRDRTGSRNRNGRDMQWDAEPEQNRSKDPSDSIAFLPQQDTEGAPAEAAPAEREPRAPRPRVNRDKALILEGLAKPVVATKAERMMQLMGWAGGALGTKGDGITEPLAPNILQETRAGLGHIRDIPKGGRASRRQRNVRRKDDFEVGVWEPVKPTKPVKVKKPKDPNTSRPRKIGVIERNKIVFKTEVLLKIMEFVNDDTLLDLTFPVDLSSKYRRIVHYIVECIEEGKDINYDTTQQMELVKRIGDVKDCILYTESTGDEDAGERKLIIYKTAATDTYLITPDDFEPEIVQPSELIGSAGEDDQDCIILDDLTDFSDKGNLSDSEGTANTKKLFDALKVKESASTISRNYNVEDTMHKEMVLGKVHHLTNSKECNDNYNIASVSGDEKVIDASGTNCESLLHERPAEKNDRTQECMETVIIMDESDSQSSEGQVMEHDARKSSLVDMFGRAEMEGKVVEDCPNNSQCRMYMLCRKFLPENRNWFGNKNDIDESSSDSESNSKISVNKPRRRTARTFSDTKELDLIENKMKTIEIPKRIPDEETSQLEQPTKQERLVKLLVKYLWEFFEDKDCVKLKFLGDFKEVERIIINTFMSELKSVQDTGVGSLRTNFSRDEESFLTLKRMFEDRSKKIFIERKLGGSITSYVVYKVKTKGR